MATVTQVIDILAVAQAAGLPLYPIQEEAIHYPLLDV